MIHLIARSLLVSADMGHAFHPNFPSYMKDNVRPALNKGILVKTNDNIRYTSTSVSRLLLKTITNLKQIPLQDYVGRNDKRSGSTIGPYLSSLLGIESIDIGAPLLAMHSIRELAGVDDLANYAELMRCVFFSGLAKVNDDLR